MAFRMAKILDRVGASDAQKAQIKTISGGTAASSLQDAPPTARGAGAKSRSPRR